MSDLSPSELKDINLSPELYDKWHNAASGDMDETPGALSDLIAELFDWVNSTRLVAPYSLTVAGAVELRDELDESFGIGSRTQDELHRVAVLGIGADRTAEETLRDLVRAERETAQWAKIVAEV